MTGTKNPQAEDLGLPWPLPNETHTARARYAVKAANMHGELVEALRETVELLSQEDVPESALCQGDPLRRWLAVLQRAEEA